MQRSSRDNRRRRPGTARAHDAEDAGTVEADVAFVHGRTDDGGGLEILRWRANRVETGTLRPVREGQPISGEILQLRPRPEAPLLCDVEVLYAPPGKSDDDAADSATADGATSHGGPPQVATNAYRQNWDAIFRGRRQLPN